MLMADAIVTLITWLPFNLHLSITSSIQEQMTQWYSERERFSMDIVLLCIMLSNCFTSPIVYYTFNVSFRVSARIINYITTYEWVCSMQVYVCTHVLTYTCAYIHTCIQMCMCRYYTSQKIASLREQQFCKICCFGAMCKKGLYGKQNFNFQMQKFQFLVQKSVH